MGLAERISSKEFVLNLGLLYDALTELSALSIILQKNDISIPEAHNAILRFVRVFEGRKEKPGIYQKESIQAIEKNVFKGVDLHEGRKCNKIINTAQFYKSLADNIKSRLFTTASTKLLKDPAIIANLQNDYQMLLDDMSILNPSTWKEGDFRDSLFGKKNVRRLAQRLQLPIRDAELGFREYVDNGGQTVPPTLTPLTRAVNAIPVSTAECERGFSAMNNVMTPERLPLEFQGCPIVYLLKSMDLLLSSLSPTSMSKVGWHKGDTRL